MLQNPSIKIENMLEPSGINDGWYVFKAYKSLRATLKRKDFLLALLKENGCNIINFHDSKIIQAAEYLSFNFRKGKRHYEFHIEKNGDNLNIINTHRQIESENHRKKGLGTRDLKLFEEGFATLKKVFLEVKISFTQLNGQKDTINWLQKNQYELFLSPKENDIIGEKVL